MAKIAFLLPKTEMVEIASKLVLQMGIQNVQIIQYVPSGQAINFGCTAVENGAEIIIARGLQASQIKQITSIPVVEIKMTGQEMGLLVARGKKILGLVCPTIGIVGYHNMFCNMDFFEEIYGVVIKRYYVEHSKDGLASLQKQAGHAVRDRVDIIIGGEIAMEVAKKADIPFLFLLATKDSICEGLLTAQQVGYASDLEKANTAELKTLLDNSFGAVTKLDCEGRVVIVNHVAEYLIGWKINKMIGCHITDLVKEINLQELETVLNEGKEIFSKFITINNISLVANLAPIKAGDKITGAIFTCQEVKRVEEMGKAARRELYRQGYVAKCNFTLLKEPSEHAQRMLSTARIYAQSDTPVLILSEPGCGQDLYAQSIHNDSLRKNGPYVSVYCEELSAQEQLVTLFGSTNRINSQNSIKGLIATAQGGTLFLNGIDRLGKTSQFRLLRLIQSGVLVSNNEQNPLPLEVRIIAASGRDIPVLVEKGEFHQELFYALNSLLLDIIPLRDRPQDIVYLVDQNIKLFCDRYKRYISLTNGAKQQLLEYSWNGNITQLKSFCERIVLTAQRRNVDENYIDRLFCEMYPLVRLSKTIAPVIVYKDPQAAEIAQLLEQHGGKRNVVAHEMGISTTTLWRKIKKYNIACK